MKVTVSKYLNVRVGQPRLDAPNYQYLAPGSILEVDGKLYDGQTYDNNDKWYRDYADNYYWSGGVENTEENLISKRLKSLNPFQYYEGNGQDIGVGIFDSGVNREHKYLKRRVKFYKNFITNSDLSSIHHHGHNIASIIASDDTKTERNISNLYCFRVISEHNFTDNDALLSSLSHLNSNNNLIEKLDIINLSLEIGDTSYYLPIVQDEIDKLLRNGIITVVAGGNNCKTLDIANLKNIIKVGTFEENHIKSFIKNGIPSSYDVCCLNVPIPCYPLNGDYFTSEISDASAYTAFITAVLAKFLSLKNIPKNEHRLSVIKNYLSRNSKSINNNVQPFRIYK